MIWFSEPCFITVILTLIFIFANNVCCVQQPIVIIIHTNLLTSTEGTPIYFMRTKGRIFWQKYNFQFYVLYEDLWQSRTNTISYELYTIESSLLFKDIISWNRWQSRTNTISYELYTIESSLLFKDIISWNIHKNFNFNIRETWVEFFAYSLIDE